MAELTTQRNGLRAFVDRAPALDRFNQINGGFLAVCSKPTFPR